MAWITRGLREGIVTSRYPRKPDDYGPTFRAGVSVRTDIALTDADIDIDAPQNITELCPTKAISIDDHRLRIDRGRCIICGRCVHERPELFVFDADPEVAAFRREMLIVPESDRDLAELPALQDHLASRVRALRRSVAIRHLDCGSDGAAEWEIAALTNPIYDIQRFGVFFTASPRHADLLLVTGAGATGMLGPLERTFEAMPSPKVVIAVGSDAASGGLFADSYATRGGIGDEIAVDVFIPGSPPSPFSILHGILLAIGLLPHQVDTPRTRSRRTKLPDGAPAEAGQ